MNQEDLELLAKIMHELTYVVPGRIVSFEVEFDTCFVTVVLDENDEYRVQLEVDDE